MSATGSTHRVQFYEDPAFLGKRIAGFLCDALSNRGAAIAVGRPRILAALDRELRSRAVDVDELVRTQRLVMLDAGSLLATFMVDNLPDPVRFDASVGGLLRRTAEARPDAPIHIYGEMVDILWSADQVEAVLALEKLWNVLCAQTKCALLCGYQLGGLGDPHVHEFEAVCAQHDTISTERSETPQSTAVVTHAIADLERRAVSLENEVTRRIRIERRMQHLLELTCELAGVSTIDEVGRLAIDKALAAVGAAGVALWMRNGAQLEAIGMSRRVAAPGTKFETLDLDLAMPVTEVVRTGEPIFLRSADDYRRQFPESYDRVVAHLPYARIAFAVLPLVANTTIVGAICFTYDRDREFDASDRTFKTIIARQCALALERVQVHHEQRSLREAAEAAAAAERAARANSELLYQLTSKLNLIDDIEEICDLALTTVERGAHCERSAILFLDANGVMRFTAHHDLSAEYRAAVDGHSVWRLDDPDPTTVVVSDCELDPSWAGYRDVFRAERIRALAFVPLIHHRQLIGKLMLYRDTPRAFTADELQVASTVAVHVALGVERAQAERALSRAFSEERAAHLEAEEATRAREEILSVVSHDLRSPLNTILLGASTLLQLEVGDRNQRIRPVAQRIHRQAERMARLIEDLVDFAAIQTGRVALERSSHRPTEILDAANDIFGAIAVERGLRFETRAPPGLPPIECDSERAVQVLSNLVANALKVTPRGGEIAIGAEPREREVVFFVRDTGPGIDPKDLPNLFERFWRGKESSYRGAGLGLSIARGIVDAHGGRIWAESQLGVGSTFYFSLSSLRN